MGPNRLRIQRVPRVISMGIKRVEREASGQSLSREVLYPYSLCVTSQRALGQICLFIVRNTGG